MALPTVVNVWLAFEPRVVMAAMQTTIMSASMTAYSTAVGPSSLFKKFRTQLITLFIVCSFRQPGDPPSGHNVGGPMVLRPRFATGLPFRESSAFHTESYART